MKPQTVAVLSCLTLAWAGAAAIDPAITLGPDAAFAHGAKFSAGEPGDAKKPSRTIVVVMREDHGTPVYEPSRIQVRRGEQIKFVLRNEGEENHEFMLATAKENIKHGEEMRKHPDMEHDDPNGLSLKPGKSGELLWRFTRSGTFEYACLVANHRDYGMYGTIIVK